MSIDIFTQGNSSIEQLIATTLQLESQPRIRLEERKAELDKRNTVLSELDSKLSKLSSVAERLTDVITDYFAAKTASVSDSEIFSATASSNALAGDHEITISRLAVADTRVSKQFETSGTTLRSFFDTNGSQTFEIEVAHPTSEDKNHRESISVVVDPTGEDDDSIMDEIALAINNAMSAAVSAETIDADEKVTASVVHETDGTSRMVFKSGQSGYTNRMDFTDSAASLLNTMEIDLDALTTGTSGGYVTEIGSSSTDSSLNAQLSVDGLTFYRDSNSISDVLDGVTLNLRGTTSTKESLQINVDTEKVKQELQDLLDAYNDVILYLREKQRVDGELNVRGPLAGDSTYSYLKSNLFNIMIDKVSGVSSGNASYISELGITAASDGTLSFTDDDKFENAIAAGSGAVSDLFNNSSSGIAEELKAFLKDYIKVGGIIHDGQSSISDRIRTLEGRISRFDDRLARREEQLREQFARMQEASQLLGGQQASFASLASAIRF